MRNFFKTVAIVTVFSICEKFLGFLYRIYLSRTIGSEGIGIYQVALSVFALLLTFCSSGTPITVSRLMAKYRAHGSDKSVQQVITAGLSFTLLISVPICVIFFSAHSAFSFLFTDERCMKIFLIVLPGLIFTSLYSVIRGVFWGDKDFLPYSIIELLEELCMITVGIILIERATDIYDGAVKAGVAVLISYIFSFSLATAVFFIRKHRITNPKSQFKPLLFSALPITAMRTANSLSVSLVSILLPLRLVDAGMTNAEAMSAFGSAMGQAIPLLFIPTTLIGSFTLVLVPEISENYYKKRFFYLKRDVEKAIKFTTFLTCLFIPVFFVCGEEIGVLVFNSHQCGKYLTASAFLMLFMGLSSVTTSVLNSMGLENLTLLFFVISSAFMLLCVWFLPQVTGIYALLIGFTFVYGLTTVLNLILLKKKCPHALEYKKTLCFSVLFLLPTTLIGGMLEKMLLPILGTLFTFLSVSIIMVIFNALLYVGFNIIPLNKILFFMGKKKALKKASS